MAFTTLRAGTIYAGDISCSSLRITDPSKEFETTPLNPWFTVQGGMYTSVSANNWALGLIFDSNAGGSTVQAPTAQGWYNYWAGEGIDIKKINPDNTRITWKTVIIREYSNNRWKLDTNTGIVGTAANPADPLEREVTAIAHWTYAGDGTTDLVQVWLQ
jgi:hypothetical protein